MADLEPRWSRTKGYGYRADGSFDGESYALACALVVFGRTVRDRYRCLFGPLECGGVCCLPKGHPGDVHLCEGDEGGVPGTCPA